MVLFSKVAVRQQELLKACVSGKASAKITGRSISHAPGKRNKDSAGPRNERNERNKREQKEQKGTRDKREQKEQKGTKGTRGKQGTKRQGTKGSEGPRILPCACTPTTYASSPLPTAT
eukprot:350100-Chlamydomonas_euryale.AAC.2